MIGCVPRLGHCHVSLVINNCVLRSGVDEELVVVATRFPIRDQIVRCFRSLILRFSVCTNTIACMACPFTWRETRFILVILIENNEYKAG